MENKKLLFMGLRYLVLILVAIPGLKLFYFIFSPLTIYPSYWLFNLFFDTTLRGTTILVNSLSIEIIGACIAGSAYYFLLILNLSTPKIKIEKRIWMLLIGFGAFLIINILRIFVLGILHVSGSAFFDVAHKLFWYLGTTVIVIAIWFVEIKIFKVKTIPFYSDVKAILNKKS